MFEELNRARNLALTNPYEFCREFLELSGRIEQEKLIQFLCTLCENFSMTLWKLETQSNINEFKHDCADVLSEKGNIKIYEILMTFSEKYIFIDYEDEEIRAVDELFTVLDYMDDIEVFANLEAEERMTIFLWVAENYQL